MIAVWWYSGTPFDKTFDRLVHHTINRTQRSDFTHVCVQVGDAVLTHGRNQTSFWADAHPLEMYAPPEQVWSLSESSPVTYADLRIYEGLPFSWPRTLWNQVVRKLRLPKFLLVDNINCVELTVMVLRHLGYDVDAHDFDQLEDQLEARRLPLHR